MKVDALVLAGGRVDGFSIENRPPIKALLSLGGQPMIEYVLKALRESQSVERIVILTPKKLEDESWAGLADELIYTDDIITVNIEAGLKHLGPEGSFLLVSSDVPLITAEAIDDFLEETKKIDADVYYPVISKESVERTFPGSTRTYIKLRDGAFTGGNIFLIKKKAFIDNKVAGERLFSYRKRPLKMIGLIGIPTIIQFFLRLLTIKKLEKKASIILSCKSRALITEHAEIGVDVDKQSDLDLFEAKLSQ